MTELPIAIKRLHHAGGRLSMGQEQESWLVPGQGLREEVTA